MEHIILKEYTTTRTLPTFKNNDLDTIEPSWTNEYSYTLLELYVYFTKIVYTNHVQSIF